MGDRRKCQTYTASPAEPGGLPVMLAPIIPYGSTPLRPQWRERWARAFHSSWCCVWASHC